MKLPTLPRLSVNNQKGFATIILIVGAVIIAVVIGGVYFLVGKSSNNVSNTEQAETNPTPPQYQVVASTTPTPETSSTDPALSDWKTFSTINFSIKYPATLKDCSEEAKKNNQSESAFFIPGGCDLRQTIPNFDISVDKSDWTDINPSGECWSAPQEVLISGLKAKRYGFTCAEKGRNSDGSNPFGNSTVYTIEHNKHVYVIYYQYGLSDKNSKNEYETMVSTFAFK